MFQIPCVDVLDALCDKFKPWVSLMQAYFYLICFLHIQLSRLKTKSLFWHLSWHITLPPSKHIEHTDSLSILIYWTGTFSIYPPWAWHFSFSRCFAPVLFPRCGFPRLPHPHGPELPELVFRLHGLGPAFWIFLECVLDILLDRIYGQNFIFFNIFWPKKMKKSFKISFEYLGNDPLSVLKPVVAIIDGWKSHISKYFDKNISIFLKKNHSNTLKMVHWVF